MLDERFDPKVSPYTLTGWVDPLKGYTPPLWTTFEVTVINRTRERVELDPTQAVLRMKNGEYYFCRQGVGRLVSKDHFFDYSYLKWSGREGNVEFYKNTDMNDIWHRTEYRREKPVRKGRKYTGMLTFPPLPQGISEFTLEFNDFNWPMIVPRPVLVIRQSSRTYILILMSSKGLLLWEVMEDEHERSIQSQNILYCANKFNGRLRLW